MHVRALPSVRILVDGVQLTGVSTEISQLGGYDLAIATTVGPYALDVRTSVLGHPTTKTAVSHLVRAPGISRCETELAPHGGLAEGISRSRRLLEHFAQVQGALTLLSDSDDVRVELDDAALGLSLFG
jgi:hypothetical protein